MNIADDHPVSILEMANIAGVDYETSAEPLTNPWQGQIDMSLARSVGFVPEVLTVWQAGREGRL